jgi:hypothetical protein
VRRLATTLVAGSALGFGARKTWRLLTSGALTLDLGVGRRLQPLGPLLQPIRAPQEVVFDVIAGRRVRKFSRGGFAGKTHAPPNRVSPSAADEVGRDDGARPERAGYLKGANIRVRVSLGKGCAGSRARRESCDHRKERRDDEPLSFSALFVL